MRPVRITIAVAAVLREFLTDVDQPHYGYELMASTGFESGKMYPILRRLTEAGWLERLPPEEGVSSVSGGPPRIGYRLNPDAIGPASSALAELRSLTRPKKARLSNARPAWGRT